MISFVFKTKPHKIYFIFPHSVISNRKMDGQMGKYLKDTFQPPGIAVGVWD